MPEDAIDTLVRAGEEVTLVLSLSATPSEIRGFWDRVARYQRDLPEGSVFVYTNRSKPTVVVQRGGGEQFLIKHIIAQGF